MLFEVVDSRYIASGDSMIFSYVKYLVTWLTWTPGEEGGEMLVVETTLELAPKFAEEEREREERFREVPRLSRRLFPSGTSP